MRNQTYLRSVLLICAALLVAGLLLVSPLAGAAGQWPVSQPAAYLPLAMHHWPQSPTPTLIYAAVVISEALYDPNGSEPQAEWVELYNYGGVSAQLRDFKLGDAEYPGDKEGMYRFPSGAAIAPSQAIVIANRADTFYAAYAFWPDYEFNASTGSVPDLEKYTVWTSYNTEFTNAGDEVILLNANDALADALAYGASTYAPFQPTAPDAPEGHSLERYPPWQDTGAPGDWRAQNLPSPGQVDFTPPSPTPRPTSTVTPTPTITPTPTFGPSPTPTVTPTPFSGLLLISEAHYDSIAAEPDGEWLEIYNAEAFAISLASFKIGDEETQGGPEGMLEFPAGAAIPPGDTVVIARNAEMFFALHGWYPDFEYGGDSPAVPDLIPYTAWGSGSIELGNSGDEVLLLDSADRVVDALSWGSSAWAFYPAAPDVTEGHSLERFPPGQDTNTAADWRDQGSPSPGAVDTTPTATPTPTATVSPTPTITPTSTPTLTPTPVPTAEWVVLSEIVYIPTTSEPAGEWFELYNASNATVDLSAYKIGDEETQGGGEGMFQFPVGAGLPAGDVIIIANQGTVFSSTYGFAPDYELNDTLESVPDMMAYTVWANGNINLANSGDELLLLDGNDTIVDAISYGASTVFLNPPIPTASAGHSLERRPANVDTHRAEDWLDQPLPAPGSVFLGAAGRHSDHFYLHGNFPIITIYNIRDTLALVLGACSTARYRGIGGVDIGIR